jgi:arginase
LLHLLGYAIGNGGEDTRSCMGPIVLQSELLQHAINESVEWLEHIYPKTTHTQLSAINDLQDCNERLAAMTYYLCQNKQSFCIIGGDHSSAIGTWSGISKQQGGPIGLLYIDAHLDAHTHTTSHSKNIHGMPVASLLGKGDPKLAQIGHPDPKLDPKHLVIFGARSYEPEEYELLQNLGVTIYDMDAINSMGIDNALAKAYDQVASCPLGHGCSIDLDAFDPEQIPAVGNPVSNGINITQFISAFKSLKREHCLGYEIVEFNPSKDVDGKSIREVIHLIETIIET